VAATRPGGSQKPRTHQSDAPSSLETDGVTEGQSAPVLGADASAASTIFCQAAVERFSGAQDRKAQTGPKAAAQVSGADTPVRAKPSQGAGGHVTIVARAHRTDVA